MKYIEENFENYEKYKEYILKLLHSDKRKILNKIDNISDAINKLHEKEMEYRVCLNQILKIVEYIENKENEDIEGARNYIKEKYGDF